MGPGRNQLCPCGSRKNSNAVACGLNSLPLELGITQMLRRESELPVDPLAREGSGA